MTSRPRPTTILEFLGNDITGQLRDASVKDYNEWVSNFIVSSTQENWIDNAKNLIFMHHAFLVDPDSFKGPNLTKRQKKRLAASYKKMRRAIPRKIVARIKRSLNASKKGECSLSLPLVISDQAHEFILNELPFDLWHYGTLGDTHCFQVFMGGGVPGYHVGTLVVGPLGWFPCPLLVQFIEQVDSRTDISLLGANTGEQFTLFGTEYSAHDPEDQRFIDLVYSHLAKLGSDIFPFLLCLRAHNFLQKSMGEDQGIPIFSALTSDRFRAPNEKSPHNRKEHYSFQWVREDTVDEFEPIFGRRIRKNALVKVRRLRKGSYINGHGSSHTSCGDSPPGVL